MNARKLTDKERRRLKAKRQHARAVESMKMLRSALGGRCEVCGTQLELEIDHIHGRNYDLQVMAYHTRVKQYWLEFERGEIRLLCKRHNGYDGFLRRLEQEAELRAQPF